MSEPGSRESGQHWGEERYHSLDSRYRHRAPASESDSEWADDRDGWSDRSDSQTDRMSWARSDRQTYISRRNIPSSGEFYCARGTFPRSGHVRQRPGQREVQEVERDQAQSGHVTADR